MPVGSRSAPLVVAAVALLLVAAIGSVALSTPSAPAGERAAGPAPTGGVARLQAAGLSGANVTVGVVDVTGFDTDHPALANTTVRTAAFGPGVTVSNAGRDDHGTAAAAVVARTAPDADLALATVRSAEGYRRAIGWLLRQDADVIVAPVSFYGKPGDGSAAVSRATTAAVEAGVTVVTASGNVARGHWAGRYKRVRNGTLRFERGPRNYLRGESDRATVWLSWDDPGENYTVELYRAGDDGPRLIARSQPFPGDGVPNARIRARLDDGTHFVVVRGPANATATRLELASPTHEFGQARSAGSVVAPGTARGALTVGAYDPRTESVEPFSGRGPTADGRLGVDVVADGRHDVAGRDTFVGSSAAAPYVGGVAALLLSAAPSLSPGEVERALERSAVDAGPPGIDPVAGHGRVDPRGAVRLARNETRSVG
mgnify:CR=1 FL=1